jgi:hypothetical protein
MAELESQPPSEQWWVLNGQTLLDALRAVADGEDPNLIYMDLLLDADPRQLPDPET